MIEGFQNPSDEEIRSLLKQVKTIAVIGLSASPRRPSYGVARALQDFGYRIIPVNPKLDRVLGEVAYPDLRAVPEPVDLVDVFRAAEYVAALVDDCVALRLPRLWLQEGVIDEAAALRARAAGIIVIMNRCIYREYQRLMQGAASGRR
jgi:predicted CoA-binding protein